MIRLVAIALVCAGCRALLGFEDVSQIGDGGRDDAAGPCASLFSTCVGDTLRVCETIGDLPSDTACAWGCLETGQPHCARLVPTAGLDSEVADPTKFATASVVDLTGTFNSDNGSSIGGEPGYEFELRGNAGVFRFAELRVVSGTTRFAGARAVVLVANGPITIEGFIDLRDCSSAQQKAGPGGFDGGSQNLSALGFGAGQTGGADIGSGGGGHGGAGGAGGGSSGNDGGPSFDAPTISTLVGGGGGGGGNGGGNAGRGGGGGGAIHLISNTRITITGAGAGINAGGCGGGRGAGGNDFGGGGGAGGTIVLEAPVIDIAGALAVNGGGGGATGLVAGAVGENGKLGRTVALGGDGGNGRGGDGGFAANLDGAAGQTTTQSGSGGGAIGRIRFNTKSGTASVATATLSPALDDAPTTCTQGVATVE